MAKREDERPAASGNKSGGGSMTVEEAGHKGGQRVKELVEEGKEKEQEKGGSGKK